MRDETHKWLQQLQEQYNADVTRLQNRMTDIEAKDFADRIEREIVLERWKDHIAADVGEDVEEAIDKLYEAIEAYRRGEDVFERLLDVHMELCNIEGFLMSLTPEEGE